MGRGGRGGEGVAPDAGFDSDTACTPLLVIFRANTEPKHDAGEEATTNTVTEKKCTPQLDLFIRHSYPKPSTRREDRYTC